MACNNECFWCQSEECQIGRFDDDMVYSILARNPEAREDMVGCGSSCPSAKVDYINFAKDEDTLVKPQDEVDDEHIEHTQNHGKKNDNHSLVHGPSVVNPYKNNNS